MDDETLAQGLSQLLTIGFDETQALYALLQASSFEGALDILLSGSGPVPISNAPEYSNPPKITPKPNFAPNSPPVKQYYIPEPIKDLPASSPMPFPGQNLKPMGNANIPTELPISQNSNRGPANPNQIGGIKPQIIKYPEPPAAVQKNIFQSPPLQPKPQTPSVPLIPQFASMPVPKPPVPIPIPILSQKQYNPADSNKASVLPNQSEGPVFGPTVPQDYPQMPEPVFNSESSSVLSNNPFPKIPLNPPVPKLQPKPFSPMGNVVHPPPPNIPIFGPPGPLITPNLPQVPKLARIPIPTPPDPKNPLVLQNSLVSNENSQKFIENSQIPKLPTVPQVPVPKAPQELFPIPKLNSGSIPHQNDPVLNLGFNENKEVQKSNPILGYPEPYPSPRNSVPSSSINNDYHMISVPSPPPLAPQNPIPIASQIPVPVPGPQIPQKPLQNFPQMPIPIPNSPLLPKNSIPNVPQIPIKGPPSVPQKPVPVLNTPPNIQKPFQNIPQFSFPNSQPINQPLPPPPSPYVHSIQPNPISNFPQMPMPIPKNPNPYINPQSQYQNFPQQENYKEFLRNALKIKNFPDENIDDVVMSCTSKEEALLILGIPTYYKDLPISEIPMDIDQSQDIIFDEIPENDIKSQLIKDGVDLETAELLSQTCSSLEEAYHNLSPQTFNLPKPPVLVPPVTKPQLPGLSYPSPHGQIPSYPLPKGLPTPPIPIISPFPAYPNISGQHNPPNQPFFPPKYLNIPKIPLANPNQNNPMLSNIGLPSPMSNYYNSDSDSDDFEYSHYRNQYGRSKPVNLSGPSENDPVAPDSKTEYFEKLKEYRMTMSEDNTVFMNFSINEPVNANPQTLKRINAEMKTLSKSVPCDSSASIFVMFDSESNHRVKFLLSGTVDTPYAHGLYLFDVLLPSNYPAVPPKVNLTTTGGGKFRFNPNLYDTGYVCLSIIGTWSGNPEEKWNPSSSTLLQVMVSIQSLVMDNDIIQKEPSFHSVPRDSMENIGYQMEVKYGNLKFAMIDHLKNPPKGFETIIREHFKIKKQEILKTASDWVKEASNFKHRNYHSMQNAYISHILISKGPGRAFQEAYNELQNLLSGLN